jgi:uncharacterized cupin superfamily protein
MTDQDRPSCITHWTEVEKPQEKHYRGDDELMGFGAALARQFGLTRLGIHHHRLPPGRRTSFPHAESAEEEFIYVIEGNPEVWLDGEVYPLKPGDSVGFPSRHRAWRTPSSTTPLRKYACWWSGEASTHAKTG